MSTAELDGHDGDYDWNAAYRQDVPALVASHPDVGWHEHECPGDPESLRVALCEVHLMDWLAERDCCHIRGPRGDGSGWWCYGQYAPTRLLALIGVVETEHAVFGGHPTKAQAEGGAQ